MSFKDKKPGDRINWIEDLKSLQDLEQRVEKLEELVEKTGIHLNPLA